MDRARCLAFAAAIDAKCDYPCPATQDAIDRLAKEFRHDRAWMLKVLRGYNGAAFVDGDLAHLLLEAWKPEDVQLATGRPRDAWLR